MKKTILFALALVASSSLFAGGYSPTDGERARWTMSDMTSWRTALEAYAKDHGAYPAAADIAELRKALEGRYMAVAPVRDAWGRDYRWQRHGDGFRLVSSGADGLFDEATWPSKGMVRSLDGDAVMTHESGWLTRFWSLQ